jgi:1-acyl-sn-glycerol-3-phosphate acyltransferase
MNKFIDFFVEYVVKSAARMYYRIFHRACWENIQAIPPGGGILCVNHISNHDGPLISCIIRHRLVRWATKEELFRNKYLSYILTKTGCFKVNRNKADIGSVRDMFRILHNGGLVGIFPEGTRMKNKSRSSISLSRSPIILSERTGLPVIPIRITGDFKLFKKTRMIVGKPIVYRKIDGSKYSEEEAGELMQQLMDEIYAYTGGTK